MCVLSFFSASLSVCLAVLVVLSNVFRLVLSVSFVAVVLSRVRERVRACVGGLALPLIGRVIVPYNGTCTSKRVSHTEYQDSH